MTSRALLGLVSVVAILGMPSMAAGQDSLPRDSGRVNEVPVALPPVIVTARRASEELTRLPLAITVVDGDEISRAARGLGADEFLSQVPGLYVANRYNFSLDQRLSIRGFGSRANFGVRGVKVLLDGVPQTFPDGQSQLTNVDWTSIRRVEVVRGPAGALYGNGSGGVISLESERPGAEPFTQTFRLAGGSFGLFRWQGRSAARSGRLSGTLSAGGYSLDGFRQHSAARTIQVNGGAAYSLSSSTLLSIRGAWADAPRADNPGALTRAELDARRDSAGANNILREAGKDVSQQQLALSLRHRGARTEYLVAVYGLARRLDNPLAINTFIDIDRRAGGLRAEASRELDVESALRVTTGLDVQRMRDDRANFVASRGEPTDSILLDQRELVTEVGAFAHVSWRPAPRWTLSTGARRDAVTFDVQDRHLADGADNSGSRVMSAWSGSAGASVAVTSGLIAYANVATAFETPTTTELANSPSGEGGFNDELGPQRTVSYELGARGEHGQLLTWSAAAFLGRISGAIVQFEEVGGRAFFRNAGQLHNDGLELSASAAPVSWGRLSAAYTYAHYRDGTHRVPGIPDHYLRLSLRAAPTSQLEVEIDHTIASRLFADDLNTIEVPGWGAGVTDLRFLWSGRTVMPFAGIDNLFGKEYVGSVTVNGAFGRVFEPAPGRSIHAGAEIRLGGATSARASRRGRGR